MLPVLMPEDFLALQQQNAQAAQDAALAGETGALPGLDYSTADVQALGLPAPDPAPFQGQLPQLSPGDRASMGASVQTGGSYLTPEGKDIAGNLGALKPRQRAEIGRHNQDIANLRAEHDQVYGDASRAALNSGETQAQAMEAQAGDTNQSLQAARNVAQSLGQDPNALQSSGEALKAIAQEQVFNVEKAAADQFRADMLSSRAKFEGALARQEAMQIDPQRLMKNQAVQLTGAISAVAAVSGKPGNMALSKALTDNLWNAVQTDVQGQMANMQNQKSVTDGFAQLWQMTRSDSLTDVENKHKLNALYLGTVESHINALALKEQSKVVRAKYLELAAEIQTKKVEEVTKATTERARIHAQRLETISTDARTAGQLNLGWANHKVAVQEANTKAREQAFKEDQAAKAQAEKLKSEAIFSTTKDGGNRFQGFIRGVTDGEKADNQKKAFQIQSDGSTAAESLSRVMDLNRMIRQRDMAGLAKMGFAGMFGAKEALDKQVAALQNTLAPKLANALGMNPISDVDVKKMVESVGSEKTLELIGSRLGFDANSERASAEVLDLISRSVDDQLKAYVRPAENQQEIDVVRSAFGDQTMFEQGGGFVPLPIKTDQGIELRMTGVPVAQRDKAGREVETKKAPGYAAMGDITQYQPSSMPARAEEAKSVLSPAEKTPVQRLQKEVNDYEPSEDRGDVQSFDEAAPAYVKFAKQQEKSGNKLDNGKDYITKSPFNKDKDTGVVVPAYADEITEIARIAHFSEDPDLQASARDVLKGWHELGGSRRDYADWALENPEAFTKRGTGRTVDTEE